MAKQEEIATYAVYWNPLDAPGLYVARRFHSAHPTTEHFICKDLELVREWVLVSGHKLGSFLGYRFERSPLDPPPVVESWI